MQMSTAESALPKQQLIIDDLGMAHMLVHGMKTDLDLREFGVPDGTYVVSTSYTGYTWIKTAKARFESHGVPMSIGRGMALGEVEVKNKEIVKNAPYLVSTPAPFVACSGPLQLARGPLGPFVRPDKASIAPKPPPKPLPIKKPLIKTSTGSFVPTNTLTKTIQKHDVSTECNHKTHHSDTFKAEKGETSGYTKATKETSHWEEGSQIPQSEPQIGKICEGQTTIRNDIRAFLLPATGVEGVKI